MKKYFAPPAKILIQEVSDYNEKWKIGKIINLSPWSKSLKEEDEVYFDPKKCDFIMNYYVCKTEDLIIIGREVVEEYKDNPFFPDSIPGKDNF